MSTTVVRKEIQRFLASASPEVLAIRGEWGVGKTYSWKKFLGQAKDSGGIALNRYAYVSLFGIDSLDSIKSAIFENTIRKDLVGTEATVESFAENYRAYAEKLGRKGLRFGKAGLEFLGIGRTGGSLLQAGSFLAANRIIVCIDDLERKGKNLSIRDVLGLASFLKEEQHCKIVFLLNDGEDGTEEFSKYKEKVVDIELLFAPTPEECCDIAIDQSQPRLKRLSEFATTLELRNIRVLKKIERLVINSEPLIEEMEPGVDEQLIQSLTVFGCSWNCSKGDENIPPTEFIRNMGVSLFDIGEEEEDPRKAKWQDWLQKCGYRYTDDLDLAIADAVESGFIDRDRLLPLLSRRNEEFLAKKGADLFSDAWDLYHNTFDDNTDEFVEGLHQAFVENSKYISPSNLNSTVHFMKELGQDETARSMIGHWIQAHQGNVEAFQLRDLVLFDKPVDEDIKSEFEEIRKKLEIPEDPLDVLLRLISSNGWNQSDEVILANTSVDQYYEIFKTYRDDNLTRIIRKCLEFGQYGGDSESRNAIAENAKSALRRLAAENNLNEYRVRKFGVPLDSDDPVVD